MKITSADLGIIAVRASHYPTDELPEFLMVGRSNVGKSSFVNTLTNRKALAYISSKPGKTQTLNFYVINDAFYLVDVPGYGYASTSKEKQKKFGLMVEEYISTRAELKRVFLLIDFRHKPTENDLLMYNYLKYHNLAVTVLATKVDKVGPSQRERQFKVLKEQLDLVSGDDIILFSSNTKEGKEEVLNKIETIIKEK